jgi:uracil-DNA glycosylase
MDALACLRLQLDWGADEALEELPVDRLAPPARAPAPEPRAMPPTATARQAVRTAPLPLATATPVARAQQVAAAANTADELRAALAEFDNCPLRATATNLVFADGNPDAGLVLVGEAPGAEEDRAGLPFVGASGRFLDRMLASIGLDRTKYLITNLIYWRPPGNRAPTDSEVMTCLPFLLRHLALLRPRHVVLLGAMPTRALTGSTQGIRRLRGRWVELAVPGLDASLPALPMLHPAYLLRTPGAKREAWADLLTLRRTLDKINGNMTEDAAITH